MEAVESDSCSQPVNGGVGAWRQVPEVSVCDAPSPCPTRPAAQALGTHFAWLLPGDGKRDHFFKPDTVATQMSDCGSLSVK